MPVFPFFLSFLSIIFIDIFLQSFVVFIIMLQNWNTNIEVFLI